MILKSIFEKLFALGDGSLVNIDLDNRMLPDGIKIIFL